MQIKQLHPPNEEQCSPCAEGNPQQKTGRCVRGDDRRHSKEIGDNWQQSANVQSQIHWSLAAWTNCNSRSIHKTTWYTFTKRKDYPTWCVPESVIREAPQCRSELTNWGDRPWQQSSEDRQHLPIHDPTRVRRLSEICSHDKLIGRVLNFQRCPPS